MSIIIQPELWHGALFDAVGVGTIPPVWWEMIDADDRWYFDASGLAGLDYVGGSVRIVEHEIGNTDGAGALSGAFESLPVPFSVVITVAGEAITDDGAGLLIGANTATGTVDYATGAWSFTAAAWFEVARGRYLASSGVADVPTLPASLTFAWEIIEPTGGPYADFIFYYSLDHDTPVVTNIGAVPATGSIAVEIPDGTASFTWGVYSDGWDGVSAPAIYSGQVAVGDPVVLASAFNCDCADERTDRTLAELRVSLLRRLGFSAQAENPPPGMAELLDDFLCDAQNQLYRRYASLRTERYFRWTMIPGTRFYGVRGDDNDGACDLRLDPYKITWVGIEDLNGSWIPLICGIHPTLYTSVAQQGIPSRYEVRQCIEVFPVPNAAYILRVKGHFGLQAFAADTDQSTIDSEAVFLLALAQAKAHYRQPDAGNYFGQANSYIGSLVAGSHHTRRYVPHASELAPLTRPRMVSWDDDP